MFQKLRAALIAPLFPLVYIIARITDIFNVKGHIMDWAGYPYMYRWNIIGDGGFASRVLLALTGFSAVRLHCIMASDHDRDLHNHPFDYTTLILRGGYVENYRNVAPWGDPSDPEADELGPTFCRLTLPGNLYTGRRRTYHRIAVLPSPTWTLFMMRPTNHEWGFLTDDGYVNSHEYFGRARRDGALW
jgi:hypothetical protein